MRNDSLTQYDIFDYLPNEEPGDLRRLNVVLRQIPYKPLIEKLNLERGCGRDDYPNQTMFFILVAQFLFQRLSPSQMRRELAINPSLRTIVGLNDAQALSRGMHLVPNDGVFSLFINRLIAHQNDLETMFAELRDRVYETIPGVGLNVSGDGKYFDSFTPNQHSGKISDTRRAEHDAKYSKKVYVFYSDDGIKHTKPELHYGFRKHTLVDSTTELPLASQLTPANDNEIKVMTTLMSSLPSYMMERMKYAAFDRGYDSTDFLEFVRGLGAIPIIDKRIMRKGDPLIQYKDTIVYYTEAGEVYYLDFSEMSREINPDTGYPRCMKRAVYKGYDAQRQALRYMCGFHQYRLYIKDNPRMFNEVARDSLKFQREYDRRTSVERYHSRLDQDFGFENHTIRGLAKMKMMTTIADIIMLAVALAHHERGETNYASIFGFNFY